MGMDFSILKKYKTDLLGLMAILILLFVMGCNGIYQSQTTVLGIEAVINPVSSQGPITARIGVITHRQNISQSAEIKKMENNIAMYNVDLWNLEGNVNGKMMAEGTKSIDKK